MIWRMYYIDGRLAKFGSCDGKLVSYCPDTMEIIENISDKYSNWCKAWNKRDLEAEDDIWSKIRYKDKFTTASDGKHIVPVE